MNRLLGLVLMAGRRLAGGLLLLVGASFLIYFTIRSAPGDAIDAITPMGTPPEVKEKLAADFGLDQPPVAGYVTWLGRSATGDFGESLVFAPGEQVMTIARPAFKLTTAPAASEPRSTNLRCRPLRHSRWPAAATSCALALSASSLSRAPRRRRPLWTTRPAAWRSSSTVNSWTWMSRSRISMARPEPDRGATVR